MLRYLNLDLLYNVNNYLYPLFYYEYKDKNDREVYCPITKKSIVYHDNILTCYDYITFNFHFIEKNIISNFPNDIYHFTQENSLMVTNIHGYKCDPFYLDKDKLEFLKSNTRINLN